jgi:prevent-host-death family protein
MRSVGAYEAKTHLSELLDAVGKGEHISITRKGVPVAELVPVAPAAGVRARQAVEAIREIRKGLSLRGVSVRELIDEGRRF